MSHPTQSSPFDVVVVGSVQMDLIATAKRLPRPGASTLGTGFEMHPGGKAGNQAVAAAQQGSRTAIVARVGNDAFGQALCDSLAAKGVDISLVQRDEHQATGVSPVLMADSGEYSSIIVPGASHTLTPVRLQPALAAISSCAVLMLQLEIGLDTIAAAAKEASAGGATVVLNAAPAPTQSETATWELWRYVDLLIVNRHEAEELLALEKIATRDALEPALAVKRRFDVDAVMVTLGARGAALTCDSGRLHVPGHAVEVLDTIGAGDALAGAVAAAIARGDSLSEALTWGNAAGALAVGRRGAHDAAPSLSETRAFLNEQGQLDGASV